MVEEQCREAGIAHTLLVRRLAGRSGYTSGGVEMSTRPRHRGNRTITYPQFDKPGDVLDLLDTVPHINIAQRSDTKEAVVKMVEMMADQLDCYWCCSKNGTPYCFYRVVYHKDGGPGLATCDVKIYYSGKYGWKLYWTNVKGKQEEAQYKMPHEVMLCISLISTAYKGV